MKASYNNGVYSPKHNFPKPYSGKTELLSIMAGCLIVAFITFLALTI